MLCFVPIAILANLLKSPPLFVFFLSTLAIIPLARFIGEGTEQLSTHTGVALGSILNATFGNATELILGILALRAGLIEVVKASITGSIIGNLLLILGVSMFIGGYKFKKQLFNRTIASTAGSTMLLAVTALVIPAIFIQTSPHFSNRAVINLSISVSVCMLVVYISSLIFMLLSHKHLYLMKVGKEETSWSIKQSIIVLLVSTLFVTVISKILVSSIQPVIATLGWTQIFIGVVFLAIIGNAAENASAVMMAIKNRMDLALQISFGSATQIALFITPSLVIISMFFGKPMTLAFNVLELVCMVFSVIIINAIIQDGESNWFEGVQLLLAYVIISIAFFLYL